MDITIVIPTVNRLTLLRRALDSALGQTRPCRVLVSDNGSSDGTEDYLSAIEHPILVKKRIDRTVTHQEHATFLQAAVETEWVVFLSDDDWLEPGFIEAITKTHERHPFAKMIYSQANIWMWDRTYPGANGPDLESGDQFLFWFLKGQREPCWCAIALRIEDIRAIGHQPPDRNIGDMYYWVRIAGMGEVACVGTPLSNYCYIRDRPDNATSGTPLSEWIRESTKLAEEMSSRICAGKHAGSPTRNEVILAADNFLARTSSNQVLWNRLRGRSIIQVWREVRMEWRRFLHSPRIWPRILIGLTLPQWMIKTSILLFVRWRSKSYEPV